MNGLKSLNIELTSRCNKNCWMCGRRKQENDWPESCNWGDMPFDLLEKLCDQVPKGVFIQWHNNGEPLLYERTYEAFRLFEGHLMGLDTNGKLLWEKRHSVDLLSSVTISVIPDDPEGAEQLDIAEKYLMQKKRPLVMFRMLGDIDAARRYIILKWSEKYDKVDFCKRILHSPKGSFDYEKEIVKPEHGICEEMLHKLAVDRFGNVYPCVRFDPERKNLLGNINELSLEKIWNSNKRKIWKQFHINHQRNMVPLCAACQFYGIPRG